jgi:hypothetical protein
MDFGASKIDRLLAVRITLILAVMVIWAATGQAQEVPVRVCPIKVKSDECDRRGLAKALSEAEDGATIIVRSGIYEEAAILRASRVTIRGELGAHLRGVAAEGKAALVIKGDDVVIEGLECSEIKVSSGNGACIRAEGTNLTLRRVHFHDSQEGLLGGNGLLVIEDSLFQRLGGDRETQVGQAHGIYASHRVTRLELRRNRFLASKEEGHEIKSRARSTLIEDNVIASLDGVDSRLIDIPNGGEVVIRGNVLEIGPNSSNPDLIGLGLERSKTPELDHEVNSALIENNTIIIDYGGPTRIINVLDFPEPLVRNNVMIGGSPQPDGDNRWFIDRRAAGLGPYPALQHWRQPAPAVLESEAELPKRGLVLDPVRRSALWRGKPVTVSARGFALLQLLSREADRILPFDEILERLESEGARLSSGAEPDKREELLTLVLDLRKSFREVDRRFSALIYQPGVGLGWRETP